MFGLFLSGGFNLNLLYIAALIRTKPLGVMSPLRVAFNNASWWQVLAVVLISVGALLVANWIKVVFLTEVHQHIHDLKTHACSLCIANEHKPNWLSRLPNWTAVFQVVLASIVTFAVTIILAIPLNHLMTHGAQETSPIGFSVTMIASLILFCLVACWNMFTALYIVFHKLSLQTAAKAALDLIVLRPKKVFEYVLLLLIVYGALVVVGSVFILLSQFSIETLSSPFRSWLEVGNYLSTIIQIIATVGFWVWLAITNVFFNICLILFFSHLVKPISREKSVEAVPATPVAG